MAQDQIPEQAGLKVTIAPGPPLQLVFVVAYRHARLSASLWSRRSPVPTHRDPSPEESRSSVSGDRRSLNMIIGMRRN
jgi:hypothetical protein